MKWSNIKALCKVNFLYSNPQVLANIQKKQEKKQSKTFNPGKEMLKQYLLQAGLFPLIYSFMFLGIDYRQFPGYFSIQMGLFALISMIGIFGTFFSVFYNSKDNKLYLPLPIKAEEVYLAKFLASQGGNIFLFILLPLLGIAYWQVRGIVGLVFLPLAFFSIWAMVNLIGLLLNGLIGALLAKSPYKRLISGILLTLATLLPVLLIVTLNSTTMSIRYEDDVPQIFFTNLPYFRGFYDLVLNPFSRNSLIHFWSAFVGLGLGGLLLFKLIIPKYFQQILQMEQVKARKKTLTSKKTIGSMRQLWNRHHISTLKDNTLLINAFITPLLFTLSLSMPLLGERDVLTDKFSFGFYGVALLFGIIVGSLISGMTSLMSVGISLERENLNFIKTLPINFKTFLKEKYLVLWLIQTLPVLILQIAVTSFFGLPWHMLIAYSFGLLLASHLVGLFAYKRDYKLLNLNWQNIIQLINRGNSNFLKGLLFLSLYLGSFLIIGGAVFLSIIFNPYWVSGNILALTILLAGWGYYHIQKTFWDKFD